MGVQLFLSSVSDEFRSYREALRKDLDRPNVSVKVQEDFIATGTETLDKLDAYIRNCEAVIHLVGDMTGNLARPQSVTSIAKRYPDFGTRLPVMKRHLVESGPALSYTQWEAWLALYHDKPLFIAVPASDAKRDDKYCLNEEQRAAQKLHLERLRAFERHAEIPFESADRLVVALSRSTLAEIIFAPDVVDAGLNNYVDALRKMPTHGYMFARNAARHAAFLYVSLRGQERTGSLQGGEPIALDRLLASESQCMWISGAPGAGKTTLLRQLSRCAWSDPGAIGLDGPLLPAFVRLKCVAQVSGASLSQRIKAAIDVAKDIRPNGGPIPDDFIDRWKSLARKDWLLLLDAIDEVPDKERAGIFEWIAQLMDDGYRIVITSRPNLDPPKTLESQMARFSVLPMTEGEQTKMVEGLLEGKAPAFLAALKDANAKWVRENPLLLSLAAFVYHEDDALPPRRIDLYKRAVREWLEHAELRDYKLNLEPDLVRIKEKALEAIAFVMSQDPKLLLVEELVPTVGEKLSEISNMSVPYFQLPEVGEKLIRTLGRHTGFFEVLGDRCAWIHATFREYFAARYLAGNAAGPTAHAEFLERARDPNWRHVLLMLLTMLGDKREVDGELLSLTRSGAEGASFAVQALIEGVRVSHETALLAAQALAEYTAADAEESFCDSALSRGHDAKKDRLRLCALLAADTHFEKASLWLNNLLAGRCRAAPQLDRRHGWNPQWFDYLRELRASDALIEVCDDENAILMSRAFALRALAKVAGESAAVRLEPLLESARDDSVATSILALEALRSDRAELALKAFSCSAPDWRATNDVLDFFVEKGGLPEASVFLKSKPHARAAIALAAHGEEVTVPAERLGIVRIVLGEFLAADARASLDGNGPPLEAFEKLILACEDDDALIDELFEYGALEQKALESAYLVAKKLSVERFQRWLRRPTLSVATALIVADGLLMRTLSTEDLATLEREFEAWYANIRSNEDSEIMHGFLRARIAMQRKDLQAVNDGLDAVLKHPDITLPFGRVALSVSLARGASRLKSGLLFDADDKDAAIAALNAQLERNPDDAMSHDQRANLLYDCGRYDEALLDFEWIVRNRYGIDPALLGKFAEAVGQAYVFSRSIKLGIGGRDNPIVDRALKFEYDRQSMVNFADALRLAGRFGHATVIAGVLTKDHDWKVVGHRLRGAAYLVIDPEQALDEVNEAIAGDEGEVYARRTRAYLHRLNGNIADARADVDQVLKLRPDDVDALHLSLEILAMHGPPDAVPERVAELDRLEITVDVLRFAELCSGSQLTTESLASLESAVSDAYGDLLAKPQDLGHEGLAHLVVYAVLLPKLADAASLIELAASGYRFTRLIETSLPLCREIGAKYGELRARADDAVARIENAIARVAGRRPSAPKNQKIEPTYPPKNSYSFPMYCELSMIGGLKKELDRCEKLLREHATRLPTVAVIRLDPDERIYVQCNFKNDPDAEYKYKFCDSLATTLGKNLGVLVNDFGVSTFLFTDESLKSRFDDALRRAGMPAKTRLVK